MKRWVQSSPNSLTYVSLENRLTIFHWTQQGTQEKSPHHDPHNHRERIVYQCTHFTINQAHAQSPLTF